MCSSLHLVSRVACQEWAAQPSLKRIQDERTLKVLPKSLSTPLDLVGTSRYGMEEPSELEPSFDWDPYDNKDPSHKALGPVEISQAELKIARKSHAGQKLGEWKGIAYVFWAKTFQESCGFLRLYAVILNSLFLQVIAINMSLRADGSHQELLSPSLVRESINKLRNVKCADERGCTAELVKSLAGASPSYTEQLANAYNDRCCAPPLENNSMLVEDRWQQQKIILVHKDDNVTCVSEFRPICLQDILYKLYMICLFRSFKVTLALPT